MKPGATLFLLLCPLVACSPRLETPSDAGGSADGGGLPDCAQRCTGNEVCQAGQCVAASGLDGGTADGGGSLGLCSPVCAANEVCPNGRCVAIWLDGGAPDAGSTTLDGGPCGGSPYFCDDFEDPALASDYTTYHGS